LLRSRPFERQDDKNAANRQKPGIAFEDSLPIFDLAATGGLMPF
jgi:hypothetical protein